MAAKWWWGLSGLGALAGCVAPAGLDVPGPTEPLTTLPTEVEDVLDRFVVGANLPWLHYGHDFGRAWGDNSVSTPEANERLGADLDTVIGADVVRWFVFADGRALDRSTPAEVIADLDAALTLASDRGIALMPVLFDYTWFDTGQDVDGVQVFGRRDLVLRADLRQELIETWIVPLAERYRDDARIFAFDLMNEPEWALIDGLHEPIVGEPVFIAEMEDFLFDVAAPLRGGRPLTIGSASWADLDFLWVDAPLDVLQVHHYAVEEIPHADELKTGLPVIVGEFSSVDHDVAERFEAFEDLGYAGALPWSLNGKDTASSREGIARYFGN